MADLSKELSKELNKDFAYREDALGRAENAIGNLPSAQPEKRTEKRTETHACDLIDRQAAIDVLDNQIKQCDKALGSFDISMRDEFAVKAERASLTAFKEQLEYLPSVQPEPAIPLQWIETEIEWLKSLDNAFSTLTAGQISAMVNKWKDEQDG